MEQALLQSPSTPIGWISLILLITGSIMYYWRYRRNEDLKILRDSNNDLRLAHEDNVSQINQMRKEIDMLKSKVKMLEHANKTLEDLVVVALKQFFFENPSIAKKVEKEIEKI